MNVKTESRLNQWVSEQKGPRHIGEIMPEVLARYGLEAEPLRDRESSTRESQLTVTSLNPTRQDWALQSLTPR